MLRYFINSLGRKVFVIMILMFGFTYALLYWNDFGWEDSVQQVQIVNNQAEKLTNKFKLVETVPPIPKEEIKSHILNPAGQMKFQTKKRTKRPQTAELQNLQQFFTNEFSTADPLQNRLHTRSEINYYLSARQLVLLVVRKMNLMLIELKSSIEHQEAGLKFPCAEWWADQTNVISYEIKGSSSLAENHFLDFLSENKFERGYFRAVIEINISSIPNKVNIISIRRFDQFRRRLRQPSGFSCLPPRVNIKFTDVLDYCSCELPKQKGYDNLYSWPVHSSFFAGDYLNNYKHLHSLFNALPENSTGRYCGNAVRLLVLVTSAANHFSNRETIRATYGSKENLVNNKAELIFFIARVADGKLQDQLQNEANKYQDIVQADFFDSYHNLTFKHLSMYAFVYHVCSGKNSLDPTDEYFNAPKYVLKVDDDYVQNLPIAYKVAMANPDVELIGTPICGNKPILDSTSKSYAPKYIYLGEFFPGYLSGVTYLLRTDIIPKFLEASLTVPFIHIDDVYMTGILPAALKIYPRHSNLFGYERVGPICKLKKMANSWMLNGLDLEDMKAQWESLNSDEFGNNCTPVTESELKVNNLTIEIMKWCRYEL